MVQASTWSIDRYAEHFVNYLFDEYQGSRHVRRVATWIGFILKAIETAGAEMAPYRSRQLMFIFKGAKFKVRYSHHVGARGGIEIVEVLRQQGAPEGRTIALVGSLDDAEGLYKTLEESLENAVE